MKRPVSDTHMFQSTLTQSKILRIPNSWTHISHTYSPCNIGYTGTQTGNCWLCCMYPRSDKAGICKDLRKKRIKNKIIDIFTILLVSHSVKCAYICYPCRVLLLTAQKLAYDWGKKNCPHSKYFTRQKLIFFWEVKTPKRGYINTKLATANLSPTNIGLTSLNMNCTNQEIMIQ